MATEGDQVARFIELALTVSKGKSAGTTLRLRDWQRGLLDELYELRPDGRRRYRRALIGMPRKNGKSALSSGLALFGLFDEPGAEVYSCAGDKEQARIVFAEAKRSVEANESLSKAVRVFRDAIEYPQGNAVYRVLSAEAYSKEGLNPSLVVFDEVHVQPNDELWNVMTLGSGTREQPLVLGITTAGVRTDSSGQDSLCYRMWQYGQRVRSGEIDDPTFYFRWWGAPRGADHRDPAVWRAANPALGDFLYEEDFETTIRTTPEAEFRTKRLNQWVASAKAWFPAGIWEKCEEKRPIPVGSRVVLGFDGSSNNDSTALVACSVGDKPHLAVVRAWEKSGDVDWRVPIEQVEDEIRAACRHWDVAEVVCDPARWQRTLRILEGERLPMLEFPQSPERMVPATQQFYEAVVNGTMTHSGDPALTRHVQNATLRDNGRGAMLAKESKNSSRKIDLAVASVMAFSRAAGAKRRRVRVVDLNAALEREAQRGSRESDDPGHS